MWELWELYTYEGSQSKILLWCQIVNALFIRRLEIFEKKVEAQYFLFKMGDNSYKEVIYWRGGKRCFSLVICGFCSNNTPYSTKSFVYKVVFFFNSFWYHRLLLFQINRHNGEGVRVLKLFQRAMIKISFLSLISFVSFCKFCRIKPTIKRRGQTN